MRAVQRRWRERLLWVAILGIAAVLRLWELPARPVGLHYDEAANLIFARQIADGAYRPIFIHAYTGKEVLFFYVAAPWVWMTGGRAWGLRIASAMVGLLTVAVTAPLTRALLGRREGRAAAVVASAWVAVAFPHLLLSRYGFRAITQPLLQALTVATLWRGLRRGSRRWLVAAGLSLGATGYTYLAARLFPLPLGAAMAWLMVRTPSHRRRERVRQLALVLIVATLTFAPLGLHFLRYPEAFTTRIEQVAAPTWQDALRGLRLCLRALAWPGGGDPYIRFNAPGRPILDWPVALLSVVGLVGLLTRPRREALDDAATFLVLALLGTMLLPSALASGELTPSNLRLVGLFPFLGILPGCGVEFPLRRGGRSLRAAWRWRGTVVAALLILALGGWASGRAYARWAGSQALFYAADGEMVLAARALDAAMAEASPPTVYIASRHYRHPTVAALARHYEAAKWLTGGATLVLPPSGDALYLLPVTLAPPSPWPADLWRAASRRAWRDPEGDVALVGYRLSAEAVAMQREARRTADPADFAHVVVVHRAEATAPCRVAAPCAVMVTWEVRAVQPSWQPVVRLLHPDSGEWARETAFHYPPEMWTVGEMVLDQFTLVPPWGTPPIGGYEVGVSFFAPDSGAQLPRLRDERFAGLEVRFPLEGALLPPEGAAGEGGRCAGLHRPPVDAPYSVRLVGWAAPPATRHTGEPIPLTLCWAGATPMTVTLTLEADTRYLLHEGPPTGGAGTVAPLVEDRYALRVPRRAAPGRYTLRLAADGVPLIELGAVEVVTVTHHFLPPPMGHIVGHSFGVVRLLGYDMGRAERGRPLEVTLYWQSLAEVAVDYTVFVHLVDEATGQVVAQVDEGPRGGTYPTSWWVAGEVVMDAHILPLPTDLAPGRYALRVGLYLPDTGAMPGEEAIIGPVEVD